MTIGVIGRYQTAFTADAYFPIFGTNYYQDNIEVSGYPMLDFYMDIHLTNATIFLRVDHISDGLYSNQVFYSLPYYPITDRLIKFGVNWKLYN